MRTSLLHLPPPAIRLFKLCAVVVGMALARPAAGEPPGLPTRPGNLIIVGGGDTPASVQQRFVALAGGPGKARIAVFPMASTQFDEEAQEVMAELRKLQADPQLINLERDDAQTEATAQLLETFSGYWFLGGDQNRLAATLLGTRALDVIERRYQEGAVVGGTSAGAAVMTSEMLTGRQRDERGDAPPIARGAIDLGKGFGFLPDAIVDQHFLKRARYNRLLSAVLDRPQLIGVGIDEETALQVRSDGRWEVLGKSYVKVIDARGARMTHDRRHLTGASNIRLHLLPRGAVFDPKRGRITLPEGG
ncbi:MAG: cyanophycinase [Zoogloea sp.]|uniref:cyanophycinase n=1 Tax=Zoogloea sp. TaxID=49181 RepID=UPI0026121CEC|nr:cyanophycinase [Zoogloea sp.]MDD3327544.1 cyanophycinase [Zoogloea sp.]